MVEIDVDTVKLLVIGGAILVLGTSLFVAFKQLRFLRDVRLSIFNHPPVPGRKPHSSQTLERRNRRIAAFRERVWFGLFGHFALLVLFGFVIPSLMLYFGSLHYAWFDEANNAFLSVADETPISNPTEWQLVVFVIAQLTKGAVMDFLEVFHLEVGALTNDPSNWLFSTMVFLYRMFIGAFAAVVAFFLIHVSMIALALRFKTRHEGAAAASA